jgi:hypothetical protein
LSQRHLPITFIRNIEQPIVCISIYIHQRIVITECQYPYCINRYCIEVNTL